MENRKNISENPGTQYILCIPGSVFLRIPVIILSLIFFAVFFAFSTKAAFSRENPDLPTPSPSENCDLLALHPFYAEEANRILTEYENLKKENEVLKKDLELLREKISAINPI